MTTSPLEKDLPEKSRALAEDPAGSITLSDPPTAPTIRAREPQPTSILSPLLVLLGVFVLLTILTTGILQTIEETPTASNSSGNLPPASNVTTCAVIADQAINVRSGPGFAYGRAWMMEAGEAQIGSARTADNWILLENGWVAADEVRFASEAACQRLTVTNDPHVFDDQIIAPDFITDLNWRLILNESFATGANAWQDATTNRVIQPIEGALSVASGMMVAPTAAAQMDALHDAYYTFRLNWAASEPTADLMFRFQQSTAGGYWLELGRDGSLTLWQADETGDMIPLQTIEDVLPDTLTHRDEDGYIIGILSRLDRLQIFVNDQLVLTANNTLPAGDYAFSVRGRGAVARINRFDIRVPME